MDQNENGKLKGDFILLSEFAEIRHGPQPILTIPDKGQGSFDISSFSVRVFSTDFQQTPDESFNICPDAQVLITESSEGAYAYVHYFALNDIQARGYLRQYCICYITNSPSKLTDNFETLKKVFSEVTRLYKCGNHKEFGKDLEHRLADIEYSCQQLTLEANECSKEYNSILEDIPECNESVLKKDRDYVLQIMEVLSNEMKKKENEAVYFDLEKLSSSGHLQDGYTTGNSRFYNYCQETAMDLPEQTAYQPKRVMSHVSQRFTRQLRSLDELTCGAALAAKEALCAIYKHYSRSETALAIESLELKFVSPVSSMLSVGRLPMCNMLNHKKESEDYNHLLHAHTYSLTAAATAEQDERKINSFTVVDNGRVQLLDSSFVNEDENVAKIPLYLETIPRQRGLSIVDPLASPPCSLANKRSQSGLSCSGYLTPETFPTPPDSPPNVVKSKGESSDEPDFESLKDDRISVNESKDLTDDGKVVPPPPFFVVSSDDQDDQYLTNKNGQGNLFSYLIHQYSGSSTIKKKFGLPFISTVSFIENPSKNKPGSLLLQYFKDVPELRDVVYSILIGIPFAIIALPKDMKLVINHIKALWLFVGGHSSECQVIPWQETSLTVKQLRQVKLIGLSSHCQLHNNIKQHIAYWDWTTSALVAPKYTGVCLNPILNRLRDKKDSEVYLSVVINVLADLASKVFLYYHGFCTQSELYLRLQKPSSPEVSAKKLLSTSPTKDKVSFFNNLRIKDSDMDIIEYWVELLRRQQLAEWRTHCSLCYQSKDQESQVATIQLRMKYCQERLCRPKRVTI